MENRRDFLKATTLGLAGVPLTTISHLPFLALINGGPVIKHSDECEAVYVRENTIITFHLSKSTDEMSSISLLSEELIPGSAIPMHKHLYADEFFLFLSGNGEITIGEIVYPFWPGTTGFVPKDSFHGIRNTGTEKVVFFFGYSPAGFEGFFRESGTPKGQPFKAKPKPEMEAIAKKYGMVFK